MLSVCIPVYNVDVRELVGELLKQAEEIQLAIEVLVYDDGSSKETISINRSITKQPGVVYKELEENIGRAAIRNQMAREARFDNLLFIDSDSAINRDFLFNYKTILDQHLIVCGGRIHPQTLPGNEYSLRWTFGRNREDLNAATRSARKNIGFISNNFMVRKSFFDQLHFDEEITEYGHEDTMLGIEMDRQDIKIHHIDNPVIHIGLETNNVFLEKTRVSLKTLLFLYNKEHTDDRLFKHVKLLKYFRIVNSLKLSALLVLVFDKFEEKVIAKLICQTPNLFLFDFYKLGYFSRIYLKTNK